MRHSHKHTIINTMLKAGRVTATDFHFISNANQYFCELEEMDLIYSEPGMLGDARIKWRYIADREKAEKFLLRERGQKKDAA